MLGPSLRPGAGLRLEPVTSEKRNEKYFYHNVTNGFHPMLFVYIGRCAAHLPDRRFHDGQQA